MALVEIPLNSFTYRFRRLTWQEEFQISFTADEDQRKTFLAHTLADVSGLPITSVKGARRVLDSIPVAIFWRIWVVYRGNLPEDRYFTSKGLYDAPDRKVYNKPLLDEGQAIDATADAAARQLEQRFSPAELKEAREIESQIFTQAKKQGKLMRVQEG